MKLDIGAGKTRLPGYKTVDIIPFEGVDYVFDIGNERWPFEDNSIEEVHASHVIEHLDAKERIRFVNELYRVLVPGGKAKIITPHWACNRAYGDLTHKWPPVSEQWFFYLEREWRKRVPHTDIEFNPDGYNCNFTATWSYSLHPDVLKREEADQRFAALFFRDAAQDMIAILTKGD